jgi:hypothetical protein
LQDKTIEDEEDLYTTSQQWNYLSFAHEQEQKYNSSFMKRDPKIVELGSSK